MISAIGIARRSLLVGAFALAALPLLGVGPAQSEALDDITKAGVIRIGVFPDFPPFASVGTDMALQGYDIDIAQIVARALKVKPELIHITGQNRIPMMLEKRVDLLLSVGWSAEREKVVDFTSAYAPYYTAVFGLQELKVGRVEDLSGKIIAVNRGTLEDTTLTQTAPPGTEIRRFENYNAVIQAFIAGQVPLMVLGNDVGAKVLERQASQKVEQKFLFRNSPDFIAINKNEPKLKEALDKIIAAALADGTLNNLSVKWLKKPLDPATLKR